MAYTFNKKPVATIRAKIAGTSDAISVQGTNPDSTPENAKAQIDKLLKLGFGNSDHERTVSIEGMTQTQQAGVIEND